MPPKKICIRSEVGSTSIKSFNIDEDVVEKIFTYLPVKFVGRIGARLKRFHYSWKFSQYLDFDKDFAECMTQKDYVNTVVCIMMSHQGSKVCRFRLYSDANLDYDLLHNWLDILNKKEAEEIDLDFSPGKKETFVFYGNLIDSETPFKILKLTHCKLKLPFNEMTCWSNLTCITLRRVLLDNNLSIIVSANCYVLEKLILIQCRGIGMLIINAPDHKRLKMLTVARCFEIHEMVIVVPTLTTFHYRGYTRNVGLSIDSASMLHDVVLDLISPKIYPCILRFEMDLSHVKTLTVSSHFIEALKRQPIIIPNVKEVQILMEERSYCNLYDIADFLISCPLLERVFLDINGFFFNDGPYWQRHDSQHFKNFSA
ncbi:Fbd-associated f-box protein, partial [Thalictrum thalictroides]